MKFTPGVYRDLPQDEYLAVEAISKSGLDHFHRSPAHYLAYQRQDFRETPAMLFGRAAHMAILEPDRFAVEVVQEPSKINKKSKDWREFKKLYPGCIILSPGDMRSIEAIRESILAHPAAFNLLNYPGTSEVSYFWIDRETKLECKCRVDYIRQDGILVDFKTTKDASPQAFAKTIANYRYHVQAAFYSYGVRVTVQGMINGFVFIAAEKKPPFGVATYVLDPESLDVGHEQFKRDLQRFRECKINNSWPAYSERVETLTLPSWAMNGD